MSILAKPAILPLSIPVILLALVSIVDSAEPINVGSRRELFVDYALVDKAEGKISLKLHHPVPREIALKFDRPWEGNASGYPTVIQDGDLYRMYYRGHRYILDPPPLRQAQPSSYHTILGNSDRLIPPVCAVGRDFVESRFDFWIVNARILVDMPQSFSKFAPGIA